MAVSEAVAIRQALRLSMLRSDSNGASEIAKEELIKALQKYPVNDGHCVRIVDAWIADEKFRPLPADIRRLAEMLPLNEQCSKPDRNCAACYGTGWEQVYTLDTYEKTVGGGSYKRREIIPSEEQAAVLRQCVDGVQQRVYSNVRRCTQCQYGKDIARLASDRKENSSEPEARGGLTKAVENGSGRFRKDWE